MPIRNRTHSPTPPGSSTGSTHQEVFRRKLEEAMTKASHENKPINYETLTRLNKAATAQGPDATEAFKAILNTGIKTGKIGGRELKLSPEAMRRALIITEQATRSTQDASGDSVLVLGKPSKLTKKARNAVGNRAAKRLLDIATTHKDVTGTGQEAAAQGDPRITARRSAVATLIANKTNEIVGISQLEELSEHVKNDVKWLLAAERTDFKVDGDHEQFSWAKSSMSNSRAIQKEFERRVKKGRDQAEEFSNGDKKAFDVSNGSVVGLGYINESATKCDALVDTLLQFRARTDLANQEERSWGNANTRMDLIGPTLVAEQRILLSTAELDIDDPAKVREYALLRQVISSHPTSTVNGVFEARNAVGALFMDGASNYSDKKHEMAWLKEDTPPGASSSAYKAIHHNFSRDTPNNIAIMIGTWVFAPGATDGEDVSKVKDRAQIFAALTGAMIRASKGDIESAKETIENLSTNDDYKSIVEPLENEIKRAHDNDVADIIETFLSSHAKKPLIGGKLEDRLTKLAEVSSGTSFWQFRSLRDALSKLGGPQGEALKPLFEQLKDKEQQECKPIIQAFLDSQDKPLPSNLRVNLDYFARLYRSVCETQPSASSLEKDLFRAGNAWPEIADVIAQLRQNNNLAALQELGEARLAMQKSIITAQSGYERHERIKFDSELARLTCTELGAAVDRVGQLKTDGQKVEALVAVQTALRSAIASGLHEIRDTEDPASKKGKSLPEALEIVESAINEGRVGEKEYRGMMSEVYVSVARTVQNMRAYVDSRAGAVAGMGAQLDPEFMDQLVKQSPLHYATALAEKGMRAGLKEEIGPRRIANIEGMRVLNSIGPVVFRSVVCAENTKELIKLQPDNDAMSIIYGLEEKKMVAVGGLVVDTKDAPGGNSHLNMYAMNNGIAVLALPELRTKYSEFLTNAQNEGGIYVDDRNGEFQMFTVEHAKEKGLITDADLPRLRPGTNKKISYLQSKGLGEGFEVVEKHTAMVSPDRLTREVELYIPMNEVSGVGKTCTSFDQLAELGIHGRHLAGEKGLVLALLRADPELAPYVPDGSIVTTGRCRMLLEEAGIAADWDKVWLEDPKVGTVDEDNFLKSAFYTDANYRAQSRQHLQDLTKNKLEELLITKDANGDKQLTAAGEKLYAEMVDNQALADSDNWITRSSFTGEDRPGKSGAGQYESFPHLKDPVSRVEGVIGVIESTWMPEPIENNVSDEINLQHIMPSVVVQHCLNPQHSGVMISRDIEHGTRGQVYYQLVKGFGGGVEGGKTEEGTITASGHRVQVSYPGEENGLVDDAALKKLREIVLRVETLFNEVIEKDAGHAVDMEVARVDGEWKVVQARVIQLDK